MRSLVQVEHGLPPHDQGSYDLSSIGGEANGKKVAGTIHWVSDRAMRVDFRLYDRMFAEHRPSIDDHPLLPEVVSGLIEDINFSPGDRYQLERVGYFVADQEKATFNRTLPLREGYVVK